MRSFCRAKASLYFSAKNISTQLIMCVLKDLSLTKDFVKPGHKNILVTSKCDKILILKCGLMEGTYLHRKKKKIKNSAYMFYLFSPYDVRMFVIFCFADKSQVLQQPFSPLSLLCFL